MPGTSPRMLHVRKKARQLTTEVFTLHNALAVPGRGISARTLHSQGVADVELPNNNSSASTLLLHALSGNSTSKPTRNQCLDTKMCFKIPSAHLMLSQLLNHILQHLTRASPDLLWIQVVEHITQGPYKAIRVGACVHL
eukprot:GHUV01035346.1.p1 GENE.GHUV01035346.1~~GHUV01035346.1.p1  ORF type:complete len:139 (+),score=15.78 GHUV01035346.1:203-619(+)